MSSTDVKLTPLMERILRLHGTRPGKAWTGNEVGYGLGLEPGQRHRGPWSGPTGVAQRAIFPTTRLRELGLLDFSQRDDGLSGSATTISRAGLQWLREHPEGA